MNLVAIIRRIRLLQIERKVNDEKSKGIAFLIYPVPLPEISIQKQPYHR